MIPHVQPAQNPVHVTCMLHENIMDLHEFPNMHVTILLYMSVLSNIFAFSDVSHACYINILDMHVT